MAVYFFDTSALLKRYVEEPGSTWVRQVTDPKSGNKIYIATITAVEVISAIMKNVRTTSSPLGLGDAQKAIAEFRNDFENQYAPFPVTDSLVQGAMGLPEKHKLRGYDAVQLSAALIISAQSAQLGIPATGVPSIVLVAADDELLDAAKAEGVAVDDPRNHP
ncbi:MAG: type II toxin-antitoxin system VapC family toxin [Acidobacteriota bacterium]